MCEWLSSGEWSDVRLQCGGRSFAAHRAVLASVSTFLRRILLSCPTEDSPTFIVLPDFDIDAMSSVLYYIYNGEVVIQKHKLEMFMEIVKAMQIFIDEQYLPSVCKNIETLPLCSKPNQLVRNTIFCLGDDTGSFVNLKKSFCAVCTSSKQSCDSSEFGDKQVTIGDISKHVLGNMKSACSDRQRSFLRDLFMETYPQNGNTNGRSTGVLTIQSAPYHAPASVLLTNANRKHLRVEDTYEMCKKSTDTHQCFPNTSPPVLNSYSDDHSSFFWRTGTDYFKRNNSAFSHFNPLSLLHYPKDEIKKQVLNQLSLHQSQTGMLEIKPSNPSFDIPTNESYPSNSLSKCSLIHGSYLQEKNVLKSNSNVILNMINRETSFSNNSHGHRSLIFKSAVLNEVLDSPWRPRQPNNYKPCRRKVQDSSSGQVNFKECTINDRNNNIQRKSPSPEVLERFPASGSSIEQPFSISEMTVVNNFKCELCDQVFITEEALAAHAQRHSVPARYSCTECTKSFSQLRNFKYHMSVHRGTREFAGTCSVCGKYFNDRGYLSSHMKIHRNRKEYKCSQCPKSFNQRVAYNMHVRIHTGIKPHVCNECGKAFSRKMLLKQHQRTHSGERPYACPHCDKRFADRSNMTLHLRLHTGVKPFTCTMCPKSFTKKHHLKSHLNFHTGAKPYSCTKCKLAFTQSSNMRTHFKKCTAAPDVAATAEVHVSR